MKLILGRRFVLLLVAFACSGVNTKAQAPGAGQEAFVEVSARNPRYFALSDGRPYIPIGRAPEKPAGVPVNLAELAMAPDSRVTAYDPWRLEHCDLGTGSEVVLPEFKRSVVLRIEARNWNE